MNALRHWFELIPDYHRGPHEPHEERKSLADLDSNQCLVGHFGEPGYFIEHRYPEFWQARFARYRYRVFAFVREPLDMRCSLYRHHTQHTEQAAGMTLAEHIMTQPNYISCIMNLTRENYLEVLDKYFFIGLFEDLQPGFDLLSQRLKLPRIELPMRNLTTKNAANDRAVLTDQEIDAFRQQNQLDYLVYQYVRDRYAELR
ncbi:MAG: hypothetical protein AAF197_07230 [Pseudomonadota bacterium]